MKVAVPTKQSYDFMSTKNELLPLVPEAELDVLDSTNSVRYDLRVTPADNNSPTYRTTARILTGSESVRTIINWMKAIDIIMAGLNLGLNNAGANNRVTIVKSVLSGTPKALFDQYIEEAKTQARADAAQLAFDAAEANLAGSGAAARNVVLATALDTHTDVAHIEPGIQYVVKNLLPAKALQRIKRILRRSTRKPHDMNIRTYVQHLNRINGDELPRLPPFDPDNSLGEDEMTDILLFGTPKSWQAEMERQGFDPMAHDVNEICTSMENLESAEAFDRKASPVDKQKNNNNKKKGNSSSNNNNSTNGGKYCAIHGKCGHSTEDCRTIQNLKKNEGGKPAASKNKSWKRQADDNKQKSGKDFAAFVKKQVKRELNALTETKSKKRSKHEANHCEDDHEDDLSLSKMDFNQFNSGDDNVSMSSVNTEVST